VIKFAVDELIAVSIYLELVAMGNAGYKRLLSPAIQGGNLPKLLESCKKLGLRVSAKHVDQTIAEFNRIQSKPDHADELLNYFGGEGPRVAETLRFELSTKLFLAIPEEGSIELFEHPRPFDKEDIPSVSERFPDASYDMQEAANCLALSRPTACVCHLMRVLEVGLVALAGDLKIPWPDQNNWQEVINGIEGKIKLFEKGSGTLPIDWKEKRQFYADAATQFTHFKDAWRNYAMHFHAVYDEGKADIIFRSVREFMRVLAARLPPP